jgi:hypothetical protein
MTIVISAYANHHLAPSAVQTCAFCDRLEFPEKVALWFAIFIREDPTIRNRVLLVLGQKGAQLARQRNLALLVVFRDERNIRFPIACDRKAKALQIDIAPRRKLNLLLTADST